tara:strand:- start:4408 stop:5274 length:867 start_codon:yes stop_codon:yes gene_type:complete
MKVLIIGTAHHKNKEALESMLKHLNWEYHYGNESDIENFNIIYLPDQPINTLKYSPEKKFIMGPHFSVFPNNKLCQIQNIHKNSIYIQPSDWATEVWMNSGAEKYIPVKTHPFAVNTIKFAPISNNTINKDKVFIYFKRRKPQELKLIEHFLKGKGIEYVIFDYVKRYKENDYLNFLQHCKYGIILGAHESQGFAIEEALSCDVPLLVWNTRYMSQEEGVKYPNIPCSTIPYWDDRCGEYFYHTSEFESKFNDFINKLYTYQPREFVLENLSVKRCAENFKDMINRFY